MARPGPTSSASTGACRSTTPAAASARARLCRATSTPPCAWHPWPVVERRHAAKVLRDAGAEPGHIFNLGHGVLPETDPGVLARVVEIVHGWRHDLAPEAVP